MPSVTHRGYYCYVEYFNGQMPPIQAQVFLPLEEIERLTDTGLRRKLKAEVQKAIDGLQRQVMALGWDTKKETAEHLVKYAEKGTTQTSVVLKP
jgi:hypothetical protein